MPEIDHDAIKAVLMQLKEKLNEMNILVDQHKNGKGLITDNVELLYTPGQKTVLIDAYTAAKAELEILYQTLP